jgi:hypothetical protein
MTHRDNCDHLRRAATARSRRHARQSTMLRLPLGDLALVVDPARRVVADLGDGGRVKGMTAVAARGVEPMAAAGPAGGFDGAGAVVGREPRWGREPCRVTDVAQDEPGDDGGDTDTTGCIGGAARTRAYLDSSATSCWSPVANQVDVGTSSQPFSAVSCWTASRSAGSPVCRTSRRWVMTQG